MLVYSSSLLLLFWIDVILFEVKINSVIFTSNYSFSPESLYCITSLFFIIIISGIISLLLSWFIILFQVKFTHYHYKLFLLSPDLLLYFSSLLLLILLLWLCDILL